MHFLLISHWDADGTIPDLALQTNTAHSAPTNRHWDGPAKSVIECVE